MKGGMKKVDELKELVKMFDLCLNISDRVFLALLLTKTDKIGKF